MSNEESPPQEWKTIRLPATSYYKLIELSGLLTLLSGMRISMSIIANYAITVYYDKNYMEYKNMMTDPDALKEFRERFGGKMKRLSELLTNTDSE